LGPVQLVDVICDTSFLIQIATKRIKNINNLETEIGPIQFIVPNVVIMELNKLSNNVKKHKIAIQALLFAKTLKLIQMTGQEKDLVDNIIFSNIKCNGGITATLDVKLKNRIKKIGGSIMSLSNDKIIIE